jgi:hypothetical protein
MPVFRLPVAFLSSRLTYCRHRSACVCCQKHLYTRSEVVVGGYLVVVPEHLGPVPEQRRRPPLLSQQVFVIC